MTRICDEEEIPLHLRVKHSRLGPHPNSTTDTITKQNYNIDEYVLIRQSVNLISLFYFFIFHLRYWCATHVFQTQYTIQIVRCTKPECCGPWRSNYIQVFPHRFLPPPVPFNRSSHGVRLAELELSFANTNSASPYYGTLFQRIQFHGIVLHRTKSPLLPFDFFCPSVQAKLHSRICSICKQYIPSATRLRNHYQVHQQRYALNCVDYKFNKDEEFIDEPDPIDTNEMPLSHINPFHNGVFLFQDMIEWLKSDFEDEPITESKPKSTVSIANAMIRKEKQLREAAAAAISDTSIIIGQTKDVESVTTIPVDDASTSTPTNENTFSNEIKVEDETISTVDISAENENESNSIKQLTVTDDSSNIPDESSLNQYDDLSEFIDKI